MLSDQIADLLTRIRNAYQRGKREIEVPYSNMSLAIANTLKENGFVADVKTFKYEGKKFKGLNISLKYEDEVPAISHISRESRPGLRIYVKADEISRVLGGLGMYIISTPRGVLSSREAKKRRLGGEVLCKVY